MKLHSRFHWGVHRRPECEYFIRILQLETNHEGCSFVRNYCGRRGRGMLEWRGQHGSGRGRWRRRRRWWRQCLSCRLGVSAFGELSAEQHNGGEGRECRVHQRLRHPAYCDVRCAEAGWCRRHRAAFIGDEHAHLRDNRSLRISLHSARRDDGRGERQLANGVRVIPTLTSFTEKTFRPVLVGS